MNVCSNAAVVTAMNQILKGGAYTPTQLVEWVIERMWQALLEAPETRGMKFSRVVVFAGKGRKAAVAIGLAGRFARSLMSDITVELAEGKGALSQEAAFQYGNLTVANRSRKELEPGVGLLIIDGLLGSGAQGELEPEYRHMVLELNELRRKSPRSVVLSIDMPTGMEADTGDTKDDIVVRADVTLAVGAVRPWMLEDGAEENIGSLLGILLPKGSGLELSEPSQRKLVLGRETVQGWLKARRRSMHKYEAGKVTVVAGSMGMVGAAQMCAEGALTAGAGLVTLYCPQDVFSILATRVVPEIMVRPLSEGVNVQELVHEASRDGGVLVAGSGAGQSFPMGMLKEIVESWPDDNTMVLDAGGLVQAFKEGWKMGSKVIYTPHSGELKKMDASVISPCSREKTVENFLRKYRGTLLYKGARTMISDGSDLYINCSGGSWMAGAGQGDILAGVIGGLAAQGLMPVRAAALAAYACGQAATDAWCASGYPPAVRATALLPYLPGRLA